MPEDPTAIDWHDGTDDESDDGLSGEAGGFDADATFSGDAAAETGFGGGEGFSADADDKVAAW